MTSLDQYYTNPKIAQGYVDEVLSRWRGKDVLFIEPSAGTGSFSNPLMQSGFDVRAIDIEPRADNIGKVDYLNSHDLFKTDHSSIVVLGNPPFGKNSSTAVRFFNHSALYANEIAFILPRTFRKMSIQNRLHEKFHLVSDDDVENGAFLLNGNAYDVPCAWQIWERKQTNREILQIPSVNHLFMYTDKENASFAMRRVGFYAGRVIERGIKNLSQSTHYFMKDLKSDVIKVLRSINWTDITKQTAGVRSLSKGEIAYRLSEVYDG
ncbi:MAG: hypothetical protein OXH65_02380 [Paracoccaceae bacterium]|nr:hypothetical protein [Paracoccaceae bacterium]MYG10014.1 SAM-dependent methyltransferase [Paracoccaceae bacterium]MYK44496.1 SAM-dependent methyltransferase [Gammaproteobacteria bacterium]